MLFSFITIKFEIVVKKNIIFQVIVHKEQNLFIKLKINTVRLKNCGIGRFKLDVRQSSQHRIEQLSNVNKFHR